MTRALYSKTAGDPVEEIWITDEGNDAAQGWFGTELRVRFGLLTRLRAAFRLILRGTFNVSFYWSTSGDSTFIDDIEFEIGGR